jgi:arylsulfatase A-like enzyme
MNLFIRIKNFSLAIALLFAVGFPVAVQASGPTNIIIVICYDLNDSIAGIGGHPQAHTPNVDRLAARGVTFSNTASNVPICGPSRASLWSGLLPTTTGFYGYKQQINRWNKNPVLERSKTLFELMAYSGYRSFATGKIHHNGHSVMEVFENPDGYPGYGSAPNFGPLPNDYNDANKKHGIAPPWFPEAAREVSGWGDGFGPIQDIKKYGDEYRWSLFHGGQTWEYRNGHDRDPMPDEIHAEEAVDFLQKDHDKPFILTVGFSRPHSPWYAPKEYFDLFPLEDLELAPLLEGDVDDCSRILVEQQDNAQPWGWSKYRRLIDVGGKDRLLEWTQAYLACVAFVDDQFGRVLDALEGSAYAENTLVIFTSDHGYHMGEKEYVFKYSPWEESVRVPLVVAGPGVNSGGVCRKPVSLVDIYPTCVDFAKVEPQHELDGHSLRSLLEDPAGDWDGPAYSLSASASKGDVQKNVPAPDELQHFSLRTERYRYIRCRNGEEELYDHNKDPHEWTNQSTNPEYQSVLLEMREHLSEATSLNVSEAI